jgi:hypothetical protein
MYKKNHKNNNKFSSYGTLRDRVINNPNPEEKDWLRLSYDDKMEWISKHGKILYF